MAMAMAMAWHGLGWIGWVGWHGACAGVVSSGIAGVVLLEGILLSSAPVAEGPHPEPWAPAPWVRGVAGRVAPSAENGVIPAEV